MKLEGGGVNVSVTKLITWYEKMKLSLFTGFLQVSDQVVSVLFLLQPTEGHLGTRDVFLWVGQVIGHVVFVPLHVLLDVGVCVRVPFSLAGVSAEDPVQVWTDLVWAALFDGMALQTSGLEQSSTFLCGTGFEFSHC